MGIEAFWPVQEVAWLKTIGPGTFERNIYINFPAGAGKTLAYVLTIMQMLCTGTIRCLQALVVLSTRDLEAFDVFAPMGDFLVGSAVGQSSMAEEVFSLVRQSKQEFYLTIDEEYLQMEPQTKIEILMAIFGRLRDHINMTNDFSLKYLHYRVIHAPNRTFREDFQPWLTAVIQRTHSMGQFISTGKCCFSPKSPFDSHTHNNNYKETTQRRRSLYYFFFPPPPPHAPSLLPNCPPPTVSPPMRPRAD
jgi:ATP-dependent RNA helicase DDX51/DBP6